MIVIILANIDSTIKYILPLIYCSTIALTLRPIALVFVLIIYSVVTFTDQSIVMVDHYEEMLMKVISLVFIIGLIITKHVHNKTRNNVNNQDLEEPTSNINRGMSVGKDLVPEGGNSALQKKNFLK